MQPHTSKVFLSLTCATLWVSVAHAAFKRVGIGIYVLNVGEVDIAGGSCYLDYLMTIRQEKRTFNTYEEAISLGLKDKTKRACGDTMNDRWENWRGSQDNIDIVNLRRTGEVKDLHYSVGQYRVMGDHYFRTNLADWPFETQKLELIVEFNSQLQGPAFDTVFCHIDEYRCQGGKKISTRYYGMINFRRPVGSSFIKVYLAPMFISFVIVLTYWLPPAKDETRFSMCAASLMSSIFFHISLHSQLPPTSTLTEADNLMIHLYIVNLSAWIVTYFLMLCRDSATISDKFVYRMYLFTRILGPSITVPSFIIDFYATDSSNSWAWSIVVVMGLLISFAGLHAQEYIGRRMLIAKEKRQAKRMRKMNSSSSLITNNNLAGANSHNGVRGRDYFESPEFHDGNSPATLNYGGREVRDTKRRRAPAMSGSLDDYEDENLIA